MKNIKKTVPLYYVIQKEPNPIPLANMTEEDEIIYHTPHTGAAFIADNKQVHTYLAELTNGTDADQWIKHHKRTQNGKQAWIDLCNHYDGAAEGSKRVAVSRSDIQILHYKNEASFPFEQYSTRLRKAFTTLEQYEQGKHEKKRSKFCSTRSIQTIQSLFPPLQFAVIAILPLLTMHVHT